MIQVKDDEWALDRDPNRKLEQALLAADPDKLQRYKQGVNSLNEDLDSGRGWHKISYVVNEIEKAQARYRSQQAEQDQAPKKAEEDQAKPAAEAVQDQAPKTAEEKQPKKTENPVANRQVVKESLNMWLKEDARSKGGPKAEMPQKSREIELGAHRRGPHK